MPRALLYGGITAVVLGSGAWWTFRQQQPSQTIFEPPSRIVEPAPLCPWRQPEADLQRFFPGATRWQPETRILSGRRLELAQRLGRQPHAEENSVQVHRIFREGEELGSVLTRRVHGLHGAIEIALGIDRNGLVCGLSLQRLREPGAVSAALLHPAWLEAFKGKKARDAWQVGIDLPAVAEEVRASATEIAAGVRSLLILHEIAREEVIGGKPHHQSP